jgi:hypothetical protein
LLTLGIGELIRRQNLDSDRAMQMGVTSAIDNTIPFATFHELEPPGRRIRELFIIPSQKNRRQCLPLAGTGSYIA